tara:strand:+ start:2174 stop:2422 length:249 start_codon:yes stop_codon:yes gene_type:complete
MSNPQYKNIGKKQIIKAFDNLAHKTDAIEMTLNLLIMMMEEKEIFKLKEFDEFMKSKLGGKNDTSGDGEANRESDTPESTED